MNRFLNSHSSSIGCALFSCLLMSFALAETSGDPTPHIKWDKCEFDTSNINRNRSDGGASRTYSDSISDMLHELDDCLTFGAGARGGSGSINAQNCDLKPGSDPNLAANCSGGANKPTPDQGQSKAAQSLTEKFQSKQQNQRSSQRPVSGKPPEANSNQNSTVAPQNESDQTKKQVFHNTFVTETGGNALALDDYAQTLYEAYQAETDPTLKKALGDELDRYLKSQE